MGNDCNSTLYEDVRERICRKIYEGVFQEGKRIPAERTLAEMLKVSRITLRKSLELLAQQGLIVKEVGSGSRVVLPNCGTPSSTDMIVLIAPAENPFFSDFIKHFQEYGQEYGSMALYAEKPHKESLADSIYRFWQKRLQNVVVWPEDAKVDSEKMRRLRALGMNMVFFDTDSGLPFADAVALDNQKAVHEICMHIRKKGIRQIGYIGWADGPKYSRQAREQAILEEPGAEILARLSWKARKLAKELLYDFLCKRAEKLPPAIFFGDRECGIAVWDALREMGRTDILLAGIDDFPGAREAHAIVCRQDIRRSVQEIFRCIELQNEKGTLWHAETHCINGCVVVY
ncbi:MAG: GntR family transcriptional regulator [Lachnospiraceae bacterium]|nr:GntR family transcriptional regulator [Lachnospiraceae bacterium]MCI9545690.1 GntR family transcriptional regulator [Lachnospiraceae bacterium]